MSLDSEHEKWLQEKCAECRASRKMHFHFHNIKYVELGKPVIAYFYENTNKIFPEEIPYNTKICHFFKPENYEYVIEDFLYGRA